MGRDPGKDGHMERFSALMPVGCLRADTLCPAGVQEGLSAVAEACVAVCALQRCFGASQTMSGLLKGAVPTLLPGIDGNRS